MNFVKNACIFLLTFDVLMSSANVGKSRLKKLRKNRNVKKINGTSRNKLTNVEDGHRLITRALWRIFDALSANKNNDELYGRMLEAEKSIASLKNMNSKFYDKIIAITSSLENYKHEISRIRKDVASLKALGTKLRHLEERQIRLEEERNSAMFLSDGRIFDRNYLEFSDVDYADLKCPSPFRLVLEECFYVSMQRKRNWKDARENCAEIGGDLAAPKDLKPLREYLITVPSENRSMYLWLGAKRDDDIWKWATGPQTGIPVDMTEDTWNEDLPEGIGNCLGIYEKSGYRAYDYLCEENDHFVCQFFL